MITTLLLMAWLAAPLGIWWHLTGTDHMQSGPTHTPLDVLTPTEEADR